MAEKLVGADERYLNLWLGFAGRSGRLQLAFLLQARYDSIKKDFEIIEVIVVLDAIVVLLLIVGKLLVQVNRRRCRIQQMTFTYQVVDHVTVCGLRFVQIGLDFCWFYFVLIQVDGLLNGCVE